MPSFFVYRTDNPWVRASTYTNPKVSCMEGMAKMLPQVGGSFIQMEDEIASMGVVLGASLAGKKALTASSGPGISLKQELIGYAACAEIPVVIVNVQRGGPGLGGIQPSQSDYFQATRGGGHGDYHMIVLAPASVQEMADMTQKGFALAEKRELLKKYDRAQFIENYARFFLLRHRRFTVSVYACKRRFLVSVTFSTVYMLVEKFFDKQRATAQCCRLQSVDNGADLQGYFSLKCAFYPPCALLFLAIRQYDFVAKEHKSGKIHHFKVRSSF